MTRQNKCDVCRKAKIKVIAVCYPSEPPSDNYSVTKMSRDVLLAYAEGKIAPALIMMRRRTSDLSKSKERS